MAAIDDLVTTLKSWTDRPDLDDSLYQSWIIMAEGKINNEVRCREMIVRDQGTISDGVVLLPDGWLELIWVRYVPTQSDDPNVRLGRPLNFVTNDEFWQRQSDDNHPFAKTPAYSIFGNSFMVHPVADNGTILQVGYYDSVTPLSEGSNWVYQKHINLYIFGSLYSSAPYLIEDERTAQWKQCYDDYVVNLNDSSKTSQSSGSPLRKRLRSFG